MPRPGRVLLPRQMPPCTDFRTVLAANIDNLLNFIDINGFIETDFLGVAAIANAVFYATSKRVRDLPVKIDQVF